MIVMQRSGEFGLVPVSESKVLLRLQREIGESGELNSEAMQRLIDVVTDFRAVARSAGAERLVAVATSAIRNTSDPEHVVRQIEQATGVCIRVLSGHEEADTTFRGVVSSLPVEDGAVVDIGGGSMEVIGFKSRRTVQTVTLPLGALKLSDRFLTQGDVTQKQLSKLAKHVESKLKDAGVTPLGPGAHVVGTGGTVRNAGKVDRRRSGLRFGRLHGHRIGIESMEKMLSDLARMKMSALRSVSGLNPERADSIIGGIAALVAAVKYLEGDSLLVSGSGLREGLALETFGVRHGPIEDTATQSVRDMCSRFTTWDAARAARRSGVADRLAAAYPDVASPEIKEALLLASELVDAGSSIDYYQRYKSASLLVMNSNAGTLTHRQIALVSAVCIAADRAVVRAHNYAGEITQDETEALQKAGVLLRLADEIEMRLSPDADEIVLERRKPAKSGLRISFLGAAEWSPASLLRHYEEVFGGRIELSGESRD